MVSSAELWGEGDGQARLVMTCVPYVLYVEKNDTCENLHAGIHHATIQNPQREHSRINSPLHEANQPVIPSVI